MPTSSISSGCSPTTPSWPTPGSSTRLCTGHQRRGEEQANTALGEFIAAYQQRSLPESRRGGPNSSKGARDDPTVRAVLWSEFDREWRWTN